MAQKQPLDKELLQVVLDDLERLEEISRSDKPKPREVREASVLLYKLLIDDGYLRAWKELGLEGKPTIGGIDFKAWVESWEKLADVEYAALTFGLDDKARHLVIQRPGSTIPPKQKSWEPSFEQVSIAKWVDHKSVYAQGTYYSRGEIIRFVRNKGHGGHINKESDPHTEVLHEFLERFWMDRMNTFPPLYTEILSIARALTCYHETTKGLMRELARVVNAYVGPKRLGAVIDNATGKQIGWIGLDASKAPDWGEEGWKDHREVTT